MNELIQYIRDGTGHPIGCVLAVDKDKIGYSLCYEVDEKVFSKRKAKMIARGRAIEGKDWFAHLSEISDNRIFLHEKPCNCRKMLLPLVIMKARAEKYFKEKVND